jgi:CheY-like chemotaxis protein
MISTSDILNAAILIVDDLQANVRLLEKMLRGAGQGPRWNEAERAARLSPCVARSSVR